MFIDPKTLWEKPDLVQDIEKASTRFVAQAIELFRDEAVSIFAHESDLQADIGEDIPGTVPTVATLKDVPFITKTTFVKYVYHTITGANVLTKLSSPVSPTVSSRNNTIQRGPTRSGSADRTRRPWARHSGPG